MTAPQPTTTDSKEAPDTDPESFAAVQARSYDELHATAADAREQ